MDGSSAAVCKKKDFLGRIRTGDLRRMKTEDLTHAASFSHSSAVSSEVSVGAITTKNASAPLYTVW
jgi:hypothetical protein